MLKKINKIFLVLTAFLSLATYCTAATTICFEAEDAIELKAPVKIVEEKPVAKISKDKMIVILQGAGSGTKAGGSAKYKLNLTEDGTYYLWARCWWDDSCGNSFNVKIGALPVFTLGNDGTYKSWHWVKAKVKLKLKKGTHELVISNREDGIKVDQFLITNDRKLIPVDIEESTKLAK